MLKFWGNSVVNEPGLKFNEVNMNKKVFFINTISFSLLHQDQMLV